jgi:CheY-like chemotaxis protein/two-component sensor histidine kinase
MNLINHSWGNASLQASNESLSQSNRELDQFAYVASHDLKAPLRAIASLAEWIEEDLGGSVSTETRLHLGLLRRRVDRMQGLLNSLLEYSRAGRKQTPITIVNVEHLLTEVIQSLAPPETFTINIISPMPTISTRLQPLQQVFSHLIDNAIRHHPTESGIIEISVIDQGDQHEFSISDNGNGIDIQFQERIYTIFQTLEARDRQENIGAGLAIIKKTVMAEGGAVQLKSAAGNGASFRFTWLKQPIIKDSLTPLSELMITTLMLNILLVEDDEVDVMTVQRAFKKGNINNPLYIAGNGIEALAMLRGKPGLPPIIPTERRIILLDLNMPKMNGLEFLQELRADPTVRKTPVIVLTTSNEEQDRVQAYELNVAGYVLKPITFGSFVEFMVTLNKYWALCEMS